MPEYTRALAVVKLKKPFKNHSPRPQSARRLPRTYDLSSRGQPAPRTNYPASVPLIIRTYASPSQNLKPHSQFCHRTSISIVIEFDTGYFVLIADRPVHCCNSDCIIPIHSNYKILCPYKSFTLKP